MRAVPILMVHSNANVKLAFQGMGIYAQVFMERFQKENLFSGCTKSVMNSFNVFIILDIDECSDKSTHSCDSNSNCTNTNGSYQCKCHQGFIGNGHTCSGIYVESFFSVTLRRSIPNRVRKWAYMHRTAFNVF